MNLGWAEELEYYNERVGEAYGFYNEEPHGFFHRAIINTMFYLWVILAYT